MKLWRVDTAEDLPLAIIEDTPNGNGVVEIGEWTEANARLVQRVVTAHNRAVLKVALEKLGL